MHMPKYASVQGFLKDLRSFYRARGRRKLPWRRTRDPYRILVSEVMLQQTQVERVIPFYAEFTRRFPTAKSLSKAPLRDVLRAWQGLGYNRRAKFLHGAAKAIAVRGFPRTAQELEKLPGVGHYTARAVAAFAFNAPEIFIETNIRTVFLHHFYHSSFLQKARMIPDSEILPLVAEALQRSRMEPRDFYAALMDYGSYLKKSGVRLNAKSAHYVRQSKFKGSARQLRGAIVRELLKRRSTLSLLAHRIPRTREALASELARLAAEGMVSIRGRYFSIPEE